jgi:hypothetical protein
MKRAADKNAGAESVLVLAFFLRRQSNRQRLAARL